MQRCFGRQVAQCHLPHTVGQHQERLGQLVAQQHGQQHRTKHRQKQTQRERTDVHAAQTITSQRPFLVFTIGLLHGNGVGHHRRRNDLDDLQKPQLAQQADVGAVDQR